MSQLTATEYHVSQEVFDSETEALARRYFHVQNTNVPTLALGAANIPVIGQAFPQFGTGDGGTMVAVARRAYVQEGHQNLCVVEIDYRDKDKDLNKVTYDSQVIAQTSAYWRFIDFPAVPANGQIDPTSKADILGTPVDLAGVPLDFIRWNTELNINVIVRNNELDVTPGIFAVGTRNITTFFGFPPGSMLYLGTRTFGELQDTKTVMQFRFLIDYYYHLQQRPLVEASGRVSLGDGTIQKGGEAAKGRAWPVLWYQPYPVRSEFRNIHPILQENAGTLPKNQVPDGTGTGNTAVD